MSEITASMVKELRQKSGAGMMDAKKALTECNGNMDEAIDYLRKKGLATAQKKSSRTAAEGLVSILCKGNKGVVLELNAETDFVARNEIFQNFVKKLTEIAFENDADLESLLETEFDAGKTVQESLTDLIANIGENMSLRRVSSITVPNGSVAGYIHNSLVDGMGKIGVLVGFETEAEDEAYKDLAKQLAMHVAAAFPQYLDRDSVDPEAIDREKTVQLETAKAEGKPEEIAIKMVEGRMRKYYEEICLLEQTFVMDNERKITKVLEDLSAELNTPISISAFLRFQLGEGIDKKEEDFAAEVAKAANG